MDASALTNRIAPRPAAAFRLLVMQGLAPGEAANVIALKRGIPIGATPWTVHEISYVLFLRAMRDAGRFGRDDGAA